MFLKKLLRNFATSMYNDGEHSTSAFSPTVLREVDTGFKLNRLQVCRQSLDGEANMVKKDLFSACLHEVKSCNLNQHLQFRFR